jgi:hypothetical protein
MESKGVAGMDRFRRISLGAIGASALVMTVLASSTVADDGLVAGRYRYQGYYGGDYRGWYNGYGYGLFGVGLGAGLGNFRHGLGGSGSGIGYGYGGYGDGFGSGYGYGTPAGFGNNSGHSFTTRAKQAAKGTYLTDQTYEPGDGYRYPLYYNPTTGQYSYYPKAR